MRCLIGIDDDSIIELVEDYLKRIDKFSYIESSSNLETVQKLLLKKDFDFMIASCCQHQDYSQKLIGWIRAKKINIEVIYATRYNDLKHIQQAFRYGVCDYLLLPFTFERFNFAIQRVIEKILFLNSQSNFTQKEIDDYISLSTLKQPNNPTQTKSINNSTLKKIEKCLTNINYPFTADEIADAIGLSRITVRRYLESMVDEELLHVKMEYGKIGRPHKLYIKNNS